ncbi:MAG TPA: MFS transporter [Caulobacteraceae bacterium]|nr:MFS transporter [Caulobacteraceae bacterium]
MTCYTRLQRGEAELATDFSAIDEQKFNAFHWRAVLTTGLGVFCDGYDLTSLGLVLPMALSSYGIHALTNIQTSLLSASALVASAIGALIFGLLGQKGRKRFYGYDVLILGLGAIAQAFAPGVGWLIAARFFLGIGIGADYVLSPVIMAEHSNRADRGRAIGLGFGTMWPLGALAAALVSLLLQALHVPDDLRWRIVLAGGAIPALGVLYFRRQMPETARYLARLKADRDYAAKVMAQIGGAAVPPPPVDARPFKQVFAAHARMIWSAALLWMLYDLVVYSAILFGPNLIAKGLGMQGAWFQVLLELLFVIPASIGLSWFVIDRMGRKPLQVWGFAASAVMLVVFAVLKVKLAGLPALAFFVYGLFNVTQTGPGLVSGAGIFGVELAPTRIRTVAQSITVAGGRVGAAISGFAFPLLFGRIGEVGTVLILAGLAILGAICTQILVPETSSRSLEDINDEAIAAAPAGG